MDNSRMDSGRKAAVNWRAVSAGLFLPLLYWVGAVTAISLFGYPGVVCITPLAWLLALPVGMRTARECGLEAPERVVNMSAAVGGSLLGLFQALLMAGMLAAAPALPGGIAAAGANQVVGPLLVALVAALVGVPLTAGLSVMIARLVRRQLERA